MKKRICKNLVTILTILAIVITAYNYPVNAKTKTIDDYMSASFDVSKVAIVKTYKEFVDSINAGTVKPTVEEIMTSKTDGVINTFEMKEDGCIIIIPTYENRSLFLTMTMEVLDTTDYNPVQLSYKNAYNSSINSFMIPVVKGHKYSFAKTNTSSYTGEINYYYAFIPQTSTFAIDSVTKKTNGTVAVEIGNVYENGSVLSVSAVEGIYSANDVFLNKVKYKYTGTNEDGYSLLILPDEGEYTIQIQTMINNEKITYQRYVLDTAAYLRPTLPKLETPYSALAGTNVIVGIAEPSATVYATYKSVKYSAKANKKGIYKIVIDEEMIEGKQIKIWQKKNGVTSKKLSTRVTSE